jgi:anti-sigma factor RsiW
MTRSTGPIGEDDLQAYVDDQLDSDRRREVDVYLEANPEIKQRIGSFRADALALRTDADGMSSPIPMRLRLAEVRRIRNARNLGRLRRMAAGVLLLMTGLALGTILDLRSIVSRSRPPMADAMAAYRVFAESPDSAVEIAAANRDVLVERISAHLGQPLAIPDLSRFGLAFLGCRLLASDEGPGSMLVYSESNGERIAIYIKTLADGRRSPLGSRRDGDVVAYFWFDGRLGYAITGRAGSAIVPAAADGVRDIYR